MIALRILAQLARLGVAVVASDDGNLKYAPQQAVPAVLVEQMRAHKAELLRYLQTWGDCHPLNVQWQDLLDPDELEPCPLCGSLELWQTVAGTWRCQHCDAAALQRSRDLAERAARLRAGERLTQPRRRSRRLLPRTAPATPQELRDTKPNQPERQPALFEGVAGHERRNE